MRILQSIVLDGWSAGSWYMVEFSRQLQKRGHQVVVLTPTGGRTAGKAREAGLEVDTSLDLAHRSPLALVTRSERLRAFLRNGKFDVIQAHWGDDHLAWALALRGQGSSAPLVRVRAHDPRPPRRHWLARLLHRQLTSGVIVSTDYQRQRYLNGFGLAPEKVVTIRAGIDFADPGLRSLPRNRMSKNFVIGLVGRFSPIKAHGIFFAAARKIAATLPNAQFIVAGYPAEYTLDDVKRLAQANGVADRCEFFGPVENIYEIISRFDLAVISSTGSEALPRVLLEYLAVGKPVVATAVGAVPEILNQAQCGWLVPPGDALGLARGCLTAYEERERLKTMGARGADFARREFDLDQQVTKTEKFLERLVHGKR